MSRKQSPNLLSLSHLSFYQPLQWTELINNVNCLNEYRDKVANIYKLSPVKAPKITVKLPVLRL